MTDERPHGGIRLGLCCQFIDAPVRFRQATHRHVASLAPEQGRAYLASVARANAIALAHAVEVCSALGIGAFRIPSQLLPLATHPVSGYRLAELPGGHVIIASFQAAGRVAAARDVRLSFHPDQFVVLNSEREQVVTAAVRELDAMAEIAELVGAQALTIHAGSAAGGVPAALERLERGLDRLGRGARALVALENDDRLFSVSDLLPLCERLRVPLVYDAHHHRCHPDGLTVAHATALAAATWGDREPWAHLSSPRDGWGSANPRPHADYIDPADIPDAWLDRRMTVDVEAKAKERAVLATGQAVRERRAAAACGRGAAG